MGPADRDGSFELYYRDGWACLVVHPPHGSGRRVYHDDVVNRLRILGAPHVATADIRRIVHAGSGIEVRLVEWPGGDRLASSIDVVVEQDEMSAAMVVTHPMKGAAPPDVADLKRSLGGAGVVEGIDERMLAEIASGSHYDHPVVVANGRLPVNARSSRVVYHFDINRGKPYLVMEFDRINLRELKFVEYKESGELLAELEPPVPAVDGVTVRGVTVPATGDPLVVELKAGPGTSLEEGGRRLVATEDGNVRLVKGIVTVEPVITVDRVDYSTGNIHFEGSVVVKKDVADGFVIEATGDVQIAEGVGRSTIRAGGDVLLQAGANGAGEGEIEAAGNILAKYIEGASVHCRGNLLVEEAIMHSKLTVWGNIALQGRRAEIIASTIVVGKSLWCKKLGSVAEAPLTISVGVDPELLLAYRKGITDLREAEELHTQLEEQISQIDKAIDEGKTDERLFDAREQLAGRRAELGESLPSLRHECHELRDRIVASRASRIVVEDTIYKGTVVQFGSHEYHAPPRGARKTILRRGIEGVEEEGFNPAEPPPFTFDDRDLSPDESEQTGSQPGEPRQADPVSDRQPDEASPAASDRDTPPG